MERDTKRRRAEALDRYWDEVLSGRLQDVPPEVGETPATLIRQLQSLDHTPGLEQARGRIWEHLTHRSRGELEGMAMVTTRVLPSVGPVMGVNGRVDTLPGARLHPPGAPDRSRRLVTQLATAALVLLTLIAGNVVFGGALRPRPQDDMLAAIPAIEATPDGSPSAGLTQETVLFQQRIEVIPDGAGWTGIEHYTFAPGETWTQGKTAGAGLGPMLYRLEAGTMTVRAAAPFFLTRAGASAASEAPLETEVVLAPGDVVFMPFGVASELRNHGTVPAQLLEAGIALTGAQAKQGDYYYDAFLFTWPPTPVNVTLRRHTLQPGEDMPITAEPGLAYLGLERVAPEEQAGRLTVVRVDPATPTGAPKEQQLNPPGTSNVSVTLTDLRRSGSFGVAQELRNDSAAPVTFLVWTIRPVGDAATRPATPMP